MTGLITPQMRQAARVVHANAEPFATVQSGIADYPLTIRGKRLRRLLSFESLHCTDWQGRVALSDQPRTNLVKSSGDIAGSAYGYLLASAGDLTDGPLGPNTARQFVVTSDPGPWHEVNNNIVSQPGQTYTAMWVLRQQQNRYFQLNVPAALAVGYLNFDAQLGEITRVSAATTTFPVTYGVRLVSDGYCLVWATALVPASDTTNILRVSLDALLTGQEGRGANRTLTAGVAADIAAHQIVVGASIGVYIPTTNAPASQTDFTRTGDVVSLSSEISGGGLDWTGDARLRG